jgi:hypothetical protein
LQSNLFVSGGASRGWLGAESRGGSLSLMRAESPTLYAACPDPIASNGPECVKYV